MVRLVRIKAETTIDNPTAFPMYLDVVVGHDGIVVGSDPIFGFQGELGSRKGVSMPFVLYDDGTVDYGEQYELSDRILKLDLRAGKVQIGRLVRLTGNEVDETFRVSEVKPIVPPKVHIPAQVASAVRGGGERPPSRTASFAPPSKPRSQL
jgi:hypothetical protein